MAVLYCDSFDHYATADVNKKWTASAQASIGAYGRFSTNGLRLNSQGFGYAYVYKDLATTYATLIAGVATKIPGNGGDWDVLSFDDAANGNQIRVLFVNAGNHLAVYRGGTLLATGATVLTAGVTYYIELKATINNTTGAYTLRINSAVEVTASGVNTRGSGTNNSANRLRIGHTSNMGVGWQWDHDDLYLCDDSGAQNNDFLGDVSVQALLPSGAGASSAWTPTPATNNYSRVNEAAPDDDTSYVSDATPGDRDTYAFGDLRPTTGTVKAIQSVLYARKDDAGVRTIAPVIRIGGVNYDQASLPNLSTTYQMLPQVVELSPATGVAFTVAEVNAAEFGVKEIA